MTLEADLAAASDPTTSAEELVRLSKSCSSRVRRAVAQNLASPKEALSRLFKEFSDLVLSNPASVYFDMKEGALAWIPEKDRERIAKDEQTSPLVLEHLAMDANSYVRRGVAENAKAPITVLERLSVDVDSVVQYEVAGNANTSTPVLERLSEDAQWGVRRRVAKHENTPNHVLEHLSGDAEWTVRYEVAGNANTPVNVLRVLTTDINPSVSKAAKVRLPK